MASEPALANLAPALPRRQAHARRRRRRARQQLSAAARPCTKPESNFCTHSGLHGCHLVQLLCDFRAEGYQLRRDAPVALCVSSGNDSKSENPIAPGAFGSVSSQGVVEVGVANRNLRQFIAYLRVGVGIILRTLKPSKASVFAFAFCFSLKVTAKALRFRRIGIHRIHAYSTCIFLGRNLKEQHRSNEDRLAYRQERFCRDGFSRLDFCIQRENETSRAVHKQMESMTGNLAAFVAPNF